MTFTIDEDVCKKNGTNVAELLVLLLVKLGADIPAIVQDLLEKKHIVKDDLFGQLLITQHWSDVASTILLDSDKDRVPEDRIEQLALSLMKIFPKEKKAGTCHYFRGNRKDNILKLKKFFKLYGNKYTDEQIIEATKKYVASFNGNYAYMRILKYFIWKDQRKVDEEGKGYIEETSDLASYIDNLDADDGTNDWTSTLK